MSFFEQGARVWLKTDALWVPAVAAGRQGELLLFKGDDGKVWIPQWFKIFIPLVLARPGLTPRRRCSKSRQQT